MNYFLRPSMSVLFLFVMLIFLISCNTEINKDIPKTKVPKYEGTLTIGKATGETITSYLTGTNIVYAHEDMTTWQDGQKLANLKKLGISALRYPEGSVSFWDWEFPYHYAYQNFWDPTYESMLTKAKREELKETYKNRMFLNDFFNICNNANIEPVIGINMLQGWKYGRTEESIEKAIQLVKYCMNQTPKPKYFYLDNEAGHQLEQNNHIPIEDYINLIPKYSQAIKEVYPDAKLIANIIHWNQIEKMIKESGQYWDVLDIHWYYSTNNIWSYFNINDWRKEIEPEVVADIIDNFERWKRHYNMPHLKFGFLEWNAPPPNLKADSNPQTLNYLLMGLIQTDMLMLMAKNNVFMANSWPLVWQTPNNDADLYSYNRNLLDKNNSSWVTPASVIFEAFSYVQNCEILENNYDNSTGLRLLTVKRNQNQSYVILILNKSLNDETIEIILPNGVSRITEAKEFKESPGEYKVHTNTIFPKLEGKETRLAIPGSSFVYILLE